MKKWIVLLLLLLSLVLVIILPTTPNPSLFVKLESKLQQYKSEFPEANYAILIDYDKPVFKKRLWVVDLNSQEILINSWVSHARASGMIWAKEFSNEPASKVSCKGVFKTQDSYVSNYGKGKFRIGMRLNGLEKGVNDNALARNIVFHTSFPTWSQGCFMTFPETNKKIIDLTKNGNIVVVN